ncbi:MAG: CopD family protein [Saprospiraceae bacterium]|jgi:putative membrane protein|nr:CopD family protein [Saprospiraceae bacterium]MBK9687602.1 CopD family protein [Saprospiraceae bacterium]HMS98291.1 CopD family protein [Saprospiraceae bacterium]
MLILLLKTVHIIGFVAWFAAMFYLGRLFVYHKEALEANDDRTGILTAQYKLMEWRVYKIIMTPAMILTWVCGTWMVVSYGMDWFKLNPWMHIKLLFLLILSGYHGYSKGIIKKLENNAVKFTSMGFRYFNEVPTLLLLVIVALAVFRNQTSPVYLTMVMCGTIALIIFFTLLYKKIRSQS